MMTLLVVGDVSFGAVGSNANLVVNESYRWSGLGLYIVLETSFQRSP